MRHDDAEELGQINIRPGSRILGALRHLNYKPWFALAEFVDNSLQSYMANAERIQGASQGRQTRVIVSIDIDGSAPGRIKIRDNAGGIGLKEFARAFRAAEVPPDIRGLSEYGMGMKSAACWFAPRWHVRTSALGESLERIVMFDIARIVRDNLDEIAVESKPAPEELHFTEVVMDAPYTPIVGRTSGKVREHLADIYRCFIRDNILLLRINGDALVFEEPAVLRAPYYRELSGAPIIWRKEIDLDLGGGQHVKGFAALRQEGKAARAGFALFRRNRLIQGSGDEGWKHPEVFGSPNSYRYQRLFGELHLDGFDVSHTKDGFKWTDEATFAQLLADELDSGDMPLLKQGEGHRQNPPRAIMQRGAVAAVAGTTEDMRENLEDALPPAAEEASRDDPLIGADPLQANGTPALADAELSFDFWGTAWNVVVRISDDDSQDDWLDVGDAEVTDGGRRIVLQLAGAHPFMARFAHRDPEVMQALLRVAASLGLSEAILRNIGSPNPAAIRRTTNDLLRDVFSRI